MQKIPFLHSLFYGKGTSPETHCPYKYFAIVSPFELRCGRVENRAKLEELEEKSRINRIYLSKLDKTCQNLKIIINYIYINI